MKNLPESNPYLLSLEKGVYFMKLLSGDVQLTMQKIVIE